MNLINRDLLFLDISKRKYFSTNRNKDALEFVMRFGHFSMQQNFIFNFNSGTFRREMERNEYCRIISFVSLGFTSFNFGKFC